MAKPTEIAEVEKKVESAIAEVSKFVIKNDDDMGRAAVVLTNVKKLQKFMKQEKDKILSPLKEAVNATREMFAPLEEKIDNAESDLRTSIGAYQAKKDAATKAKEDKILKNAEEGKIKEGTAIRQLEKLPEQAKSVHTGEGTVSFRTVKKVRMKPLVEAANNAEALSFLAKEGYIVWDEVKVRKNALAGFVIPGVEIYEEKEVATRV